jgi:hypothetical protein
MSNPYAPPRESSEKRAREDRPLRRRAATIFGGLLFAAVAIAMVCYALGLLLS